MYAQPPAVGERVGESRSIGIRGLSIRLPEINLELPEIRLPSFFCARRGAEMRTESARAPYVRGQAATYGMMAPGGVAETERLELYRLEQDREIQLERVREVSEVKRLREEHARVLAENERLRAERSMQSRPSSSRERGQAPPVPPDYRPQPSPCVPQEMPPVPCNGSAGGQYPQTFGTEQHLVPPAPSPDLSLLLEQVRRQEAMLAELRRSIEQSHQSTIAALPQITGAGTWTAAPQIPGSQVGLSPGVLPPAGDEVQHAGYEAAGTASQEPPMLHIPIIQPPNGVHSHTYPLYGER